MLFHIQIEDGNEKRKRYGHGACCWEDMLVIAGGSKHYNKVTHMRECLNDVMVYNPIDSRWTNLQCAGASFEHRRYHSVCLVGKYMIVYGGINSFDKYLGNLMALLLGQSAGKDWKQRMYKWSEITTTGIKPRRLAFHTIKLVLNSERYKNFSTLDIYSFSDSNQTISKVLCNKI